jgi:hypothetical protein
MSDKKAVKYARHRFLIEDSINNAVEITSYNALVCAVRRGVKPNRKYPVSKYTVSVVECSSANSWVKFAVYLEGYGLQGFLNKKISRDNQN